MAACEHRTGGKGLGELDRALFEALHPDGRRIIVHWVQRGLAHESPFPGFIYLWMAMNGWGACVADTDRDRAWVDAVAADDDLAEAFDRQVGQRGEVASRAEAFRSLWPIFRSAELRQLGVWMPDGTAREDRILEYKAAGATSFEPSCFDAHDGACPLDWWHCFQTLYRVRNNLFHGEKATYVANDRTIVEAAYGLLSVTLRELDVIEGTRRRLGLD